MSTTAPNSLKQGFSTLRSAFFAVGLFSLFINLAGLIVPLYMLQIYDRVLASQSRETLIAITALAVALLIMIVFVEVARSRVLVRAGATLDASLGAPLFATAMEAPAANQQDSASQPLRDLDALRVFMTGSGVLALFDAPWTPIYLAIIYVFHPWLGVVATMGAFIILALAIAGEMAIRGPMREAGSSTRWSNELIEIFSRSSNSIRAMGMLSPLQALWQSHRRDGVAWQARASDRLAVLQSVAKSVRLSLQVAILGVGAWLVIDGATTAGVMIAASIVMGRALAPVEAALGQWRGFVNARGAYHRLKGALERPATSVERMSLPAPLGQLEVENVGLRHAEGEAPVLSGITFSIKAGETLGLIGPSGAGKSSLARLLVGIGAPTLGSVRLDGVEVSSWPKTELGKYLGYLPQEIELLGGTIAQNICRFGSAEPSDIVAAAVLAGAHEMILRLPQGYDTMVENGGGNISGGQRQRLGLARALFGDTRLVVLDEPNANLDADGEAALRRVLSVLKERKQTIIVISHKPPLLSAADKLMVLNQGRVTLFGPAGSVMAEMAARAGKAGPGLNKVTPLSKARPRSSSVEVGDAKASLNA